MTETLLNIYLVIEIAGKIFGGLLAFAIIAFFLFAGLMHNELDSYKVPKDKDKKEQP